MLKITKLDFHKYIQISLNLFLCPHANDKPSFMKEYSFY